MGLPSGFHLVSSKFVLSVNIWTENSSLLSDVRVDMYSNGLYINEFGCLLLYGYCDLCDTCSPLGYEC